MRDHDGRQITIGRGAVAVTVDPRAGGRIAQITVAETDLLVGAGEGPPPHGPLGWGAYPMVPWAGRIRDGRCRVGGRIVDLPRTLGQHAIHGVGFTSVWDVAEAGVDRVRLTLALPSDLRWPFGGTARQTISVDTDGVLLELDVTAGDRAFPASIGWHPWFRKPTSIGFEPTAMYRRDAAGIAVDELVDVPPGPWDDCFVNDRPILLTIDGRRIELTSDCTDWVVYDERSYATCVEPQTGPPDAANTRPHLLGPGETLGAWFRIAPR